MPLLVHTLLDHACCCAVLCTDHHAPFWKYANRSPSFIATVLLVMHIYIPRMSNFLLYINSQKGSTFAVGNNSLQCIN